jgi:mRNA interferase RelE/StbE
MPYIITLKKSAEKELEALPPKIHDKVIKALLDLKKNPYPRNAKKLHGRDGARIRIGNLRILYLVKDSIKEIEVFSIADRKDVYRY